MHDFNPRAALSIGAVALCFAAGCSEESAPGRTYYDRNVEPILLQTCASNVSGCHAANDDDPFAFAAGNFDVTSFENVQKRRDLLEPFGVYPVPLLLIKSTGASDELEFAYGGEFQSLRVQHAGGTVLEVGSEAYLTLLRWMENGATESGLPPVTPPESGSGGCSNIIAQDFDPAPYVADASFNQFVAEVQPVLVNSCATGNCHGAPQSDFYVTCGDSEQARAYNFAQVQAFVDEPAENSPLLLYPLAVSAGGYFHTGGEFFGSRNNGDYKALASWAEAAGAVDFGADDAGKAFFADYVQPMLLRRGCQFEACHSPAATNDFKLRSGSQGFFSAVALEKNYELARKDFMSMEVPDARRSRIASKTMLRSSGGIAHRGGPLLEDARLDSKVADISSACAAFAPEDAPPLCILQQWVELERQDAIDAGAILPLAAGDTVPLVYVERETEHVATPLEFDTYQPGSDLLVADATLDERGAITALSEPRSLLAGCPGAGDTASVDVRAPDLRHDGTTIAFAMRTAQSDPLGVYKVNIDGGGCQRLTPAEAPVGGIAIHNFDPAWSPDGASIVFASTRGGANAPSLSRQLFLPQSDIWRMRADGSAPEQVTYLTNSELSPQMIREGRIILSTEKVSSGFYQVAGRRINWDRTDYHPLLAQRAESPFVDLDDLDEFAPSVGYAQATDIREALNGNFLFILSDAGARGGAGTLAVFNRSVGTFEAGREQAGYLESMSIPDTAATGRAGAPPRAPTARRIRCSTAACWCPTPASAATWRPRTRSTGTSWPSTRAPAPARCCSTAIRPWSTRCSPCPTSRASCTSTAASSSSAAAWTPRPPAARASASFTSRTRRWCSPCSTPTCAAAAPWTPSAKPRTWPCTARPQRPPAPPAAAARAASSSSASCSAARPWPPTARCASASRPGSASSSSCRPRTAARSRPCARSTRSAPARWSASASPATSSMACAAAAMAPSRARSSTPRSRPTSSPAHPNRSRPTTPRSI